MNEAYQTAHCTALITMITDTGRFPVNNIEEHCLAGPGLIIFVHALKPQC